ncbi:ABC transporter permease [Rhodococcus sp. ARC_M6]|uniref:ABC transporter permease n=1 Tax=Rhodococcus sp. ARC_M6 TaxID=2928852 RepID=UPI001FB1C830|nr:ABC transporter permease subunit [Rhodococcus sp. ARC_M6]MCJ0906742.1 ABC transporter permease subunit [Rhodococcus sp. ARC_M6]
MRILSGFRLLAWELWLPILLVTVWYFGSASSKSPYFPPLSRIWKAFVDNWFGPGFTQDVVPSLTNLAAGLTIALVIGIVAGLALALFPLAAEIADPFLQFFRAIPALAVLPALFIVFGTGPSGNIAAIAFGAVWPILLNALDGIRSIDPSIRLVARSYRIRTPLLISRVLLPGAMPQITVGIRTSLAIGVVIMVGSEMYVSTAGIGHFVIVAQQTFAIADMWSGILLLGIIGYILNVGYGVIERWLLRWQPRTHGALVAKGAQS